MARRHRWLLTIKTVGWLILANCLLLAPSLFVLSPLARGDFSFELRVLLLLVAGVLGGISLPLRSATRMERAVLGLFVAAGLFTISKFFVRVTEYPFSLTWSEGNHIWDASLFFRRNLNSGLGESIIPNYVTPGLYGLKGLPFLLPKPSIWLLRLWDAILWVVPGLIFGWALAAHYGQLRGLR